VRGEERRAYWRGHRGPSTLADGAPPTQTGAMANMTRRITETAALFAMLYAARRYYRNWGATKAECQMRLPGDALVADPAIQTTEAVYIDAPSSAVWPWLLQIGQDRGGFYGCEGLRNLAGLRHRDADRVHPEWQQLAVGDVVRLAPEGWMGLPDGLTLSVAEIVPEKYIVLNATRPDLRWNAVWSFHLQPHWERPGWTPYPRQGCVALPGRSVCTGTGQAADCAGHAGFVALSQAPGRAVVDDDADTAGC